MFINARLLQNSQGTKGRTQYHVVVSGAKEVSLFANIIGTVGQYRERSLGEILQWNKAKIHNTKRDVIPLDIWRLHAVPAMESLQLTTRQMQSRLGSEYCGTSLYRTNLSRERTARLAQVVESSILNKLAISDVYWDSVASIESAGIEPVYDLTVAEQHNFVANNIIVHNSIEQDADLVMFIYREDYYQEDSDKQNIADVLVAKHRHGSTGTVSLYFRKELTQFRDLEIQRTELEY